MLTGRFEKKNWISALHIHILVAIHSHQHSFRLLWGICGGSGWFIFTHGLVRTHDRSHMYSYVSFTSCNSTRKLISHICAQRFGTRALAEKMSYKSVCMPALFPGSHAQRSALGSGAVGYDVSDMSDDIAHDTQRHVTTGPCTSERLPRPPAHLRPS